MSEHDFQCAVIAALAELKTDMGAVREHLARLNGKVATHELAVGELKLRLASRESYCPLVEKIEGELQPIRDFVLTTEAKKSTSRTWMDWLKPVIWVVAGMIGSLVLLHAKEMLKAVR